MYGPEGPNKDLHERAEEMERMREHFFKENDRNHDGLIEYSEFMAETQKEDFNQDEGIWFLFVFSRLLRNVCNILYYLTSPEPQNGFA